MSSRSLPPRNRAKSRWASRNVSCTTSDGSIFPCSRATIASCVRRSNSGRVPAVRRGRIAPRLGQDQELFRFPFHRRVSGFRRLLCWARNSPGYSRGASSKTRFWSYDAVRLRARAPHVPAVSQVMLPFFSTLPRSQGPATGRRRPQPSRTCPAEPWRDRDRCRSLGGQAGTARRRPSTGTV